MTQRYYRGNMHMHSLWSDGIQFPELAAMWYRDAGYHFISFTEHDRFQAGDRWVDIGADTRTGALLREYGFLDLYRAAFGDEAMVMKQEDGRTLLRVQPLATYRRRLEQPDRFLIINGEEVTLRSSAGNHWVNVWNHDKSIGGFCSRDEPAGAVDEFVRHVQATVGKKSETVIASLNHPNYLWNISPEDVARTTKLRFFEVHTALNCAYPAGDHIHHGTEYIWDLALTGRLRRPRNNGSLLYGVATDDVHAYFHDSSLPNHERGASMPGRAWVMVAAEKLSASAIMAALRCGRFYASTGVYLQDVQCAKQGMSIEIEPEDGATYRTLFIGTRQEGGPIGEILREDRSLSPSYRFSGDELYVRATVISSAPHPNPTAPGDMKKAWVQPKARPRCGHDEET